MRALCLVPGAALILAAGVPLAETLSFAHEEEPASVDYASTIAPILNRHCVPCHRPGEAAPFSLIGYDNVKKWAPNILRAIEQKKMPPWKAEAVRRYHDENSLRREDVEAIRNWVEDGRISGDLKSAPAPPEGNIGWRLGEPDLVLSPGSETRIAADGPDEFRNFVFKTNFKENRFVSAFDFAPGNRAVVHHALIFFDAKGASLKLDAEDKDGEEGYLSTGSLLPEFMPDDVPYVWVPGMQPRMLPPDIGFKLKPGTTIIVQLHYHRSGKPEVDRSKLAIWFTKEPPKRQARVKPLFDPFLKIPAGNPKVRWEMTWTADKDYEILRVMPHMHVLGKEMWANIRHPDGRIEKIIHVKNWDIRWQLNYSMLEPLRIPAGADIEMFAIYDNSAANPANPFSPPKEIYFGTQTTDEMFAFLFTLVPAK